MLSKCIFNGFWIAFIFTIIGCSGPASKDAVLAKVGHEKITEKDFVSALQPKDQQVYLQFKQERLNKIVAQKLLEKEAQKRKISIQDLLNKEIFSKVTVDQSAVNSYYEKNKTQFKGKNKKDAKTEIEQLIKNQQGQLELKKLLSQLQKNLKITYFLPSPK